MISSSKYQSTIFAFVINDSSWEHSESFLFESLRCKIYLLKIQLAMEALLNSLLSTTLVGCQTKSEGSKSRSDLRRHQIRSVDHFFFLGLRLSDRSRSTFLEKIKMNWEKVISSQERGSRLSILSLCWLMIGWSGPPAFHLYFPVAVQPKLDGIRCLVKQDPQTGKIIYRLN